VSQEAIILQGMVGFEQQDFQCGPAALASVLHYWHRRGHVTTPVSPDEIASAIYSPTARGTLGFDLARFAREQGLDARQFSGSTDDLRGYIDEGVPVVILVDYGVLGYQRNHFLVVKGYSPDGFVVVSGRENTGFLRTRKLLRIWGKTGYWSLAVMPQSAW
jgi:ABC-type bacteriocin/lantibiotic exporter with double-glycine peptidase domain